MPVALIVGAFGQGNPGDDALLEAHLASVRDVGWDAQVVSATPRQTAAQHACTTIGPEPSAVLSAGLGSDALVVGGGTIFKTLHPSTGRTSGSLLLRAAALTGTAQMANRTVALSGVGAAPLQGRLQRALARSIVRSADLLVLRDEESAAILAAAGALAPFRVGADPAWTVLDAPPAAPRSTDVLVVVSRFAARRGLVGWLAGALRRLAPADVTVMPWQRGPRGDNRLASCLVSVLGGFPRLEPAPEDIRRAERVAAGADLAICLAFHGAIACALAGTPFVAVGHEPKLIALARRLGQPCVAPGCRPADLLAAVATARETGPAPIERIERERARAEDGLRLLRLTLSQGSLYRESIVPSLDLVDSGP